MGHTWNPEPARAARKAMHLRQEDVAVAVGVERKAVVRWEGGSAPTVDRAADLADFLGLSLDSLVTPVVEEERATPTDTRGKRNRPRSSDDLAVMDGAAGAAQEG